MERVLKSFRRRTPLKHAHSAFHAVPRLQGSEAWGRYRQDGMERYEKEDTIAVTDVKRHTSRSVRNCSDGGRNRG